jgi:hypothetical protein
MTVISEPVEDIAGADNATVFIFSSPVVRESDSGTGMITRRTQRYTSVAGVLSTGDLDPGPATVTICVTPYQITIPDSGSPVRLWPLVEVAMPVPPDEVAHAVINGGGIARAQRVTESEYAALIEPDEQTLYVQVPD